MGSQCCKQSRRRKSKQEKIKREATMCVRYTLLIANTLLALLGLLLLAGGVWRIVDNESLREVANEIRDTQEWDDVKEGVDGLEEAVKEASSHKYFNFALLGMGGITLLVALFGFCGAKKENQCLLSLSSICSLECPLVSPQSSSSSPSLCAVGRGGRRGSKDMLMPSRLKRQFCIF